MKPLSRSLTPSSDWAPLLEGTHENGFNGFQFLKRAAKFSSKIFISPCNFFSPLLEPATEEEKIFSSGDSFFGSSFSLRFDQFRKGKNRSVRFCSEMKSISCGAESKNPNQLGHFQAPSFALVQIRIARHFLKRSESLTQVPNGSSNQAHRN